MMNKINLVIAYFIFSIICFSFSSANAQLVNDTYSGLIVAPKSNKKHYRPTNRGATKKIYRDKKGFLREGVDPTIGSARAKGQKKTYRVNSKYSNRNRDYEYLGKMSKFRKKEYIEQTNKRQMDNLYGN